MDRYARHTMLPEIGAGVIGSMMAMEAIKCIVGIPVSPYFYYVDMLGYRITPIKIASGEA